MSFSNDNDVPAAAGVHGTPVPDMCCLCTMEDITLEDGNYGNISHARGISPPSHDIRVLLSFWFPPALIYIQLATHRNNPCTVVEYESYPSRVWQPCLYERTIVEKLLAEQFTTFVDRVKTTDCQAELRRLLAAGPPLYLSDKHALALARPETDTHVSRLWFASDNVERSAKLTGAPEGEAREELWTELREFVIEDGKEEGDEDEENGPKEEA